MNKITPQTISNHAKALEELELARECLGSGIDRRVSDSISDIMEKIKEITPVYMRIGASGLIESDAPEFARAETGPSAAPQKPQTAKKSGEPARIGSGLFRGLWQWFKCRAK